MDPEDYEDESIDTIDTNDDTNEQLDNAGLLGNDYDRVIQVKVPKVPYNFEAIQRQQSKAHLPINLPEDDNDHAGDKIEDVEEHEKSTTTTKKPSVSLQVLANFTQYCPPARSRNLFWNWTLAVSTIFAIANFKTTRIQKQHFCPKKVNFLIFLPAQNFANLES